MTKTDWKARKAANAGETICRKPYARPTLDGRDKLKTRWDEYVVPLYMTLLSYTSLITTLFLLSFLLHLYHRHESQTHITNNLLLLLPASKWGKKKGKSVEKRKDDVSSL
jgi:hypothetical protein